MVKVLHEFFLSERVLLSLFRKILSLFVLFEKMGITVPQKFLLLITFLVSKSLKHSFFRGPCCSFLDFKYLFLNLDHFIISLCNLFCHKICLIICPNIFFLIGACLLKTERILPLNLLYHFYLMYRFLCPPKIYHYQNFHNCGKFLLGA